MLDFLKLDNLTYLLVFTLEVAISDKAKFSHDELLAHFLWMYGLLFYCCIISG